jgi:ISXO2-like transposase domain
MFTSQNHSDRFRFRADFLIARGFGPLFAAAPTATRNLSHPSGLSSTSAVFGRREARLPVITTNTVEGFYSIFKRGMKGVYQHCKEKHLHRYLSEFDFRYSNRIALGVDDVARSDRALKGIVGKRLTYRATDH